MRYLTNGSRYARITDDDICEVWDDQDGWVFGIPAGEAHFGHGWRGCSDPKLALSHGTVGPLDEYRGQ